MTAHSETRCRLNGISSMATRALLAELAADYNRRGGCQVAFESVGGVDAARRIESGEAFDVVVLAAEAIHKLAEGGHVVAGSRTDLVRSTVAIAVRAGAPRPDVGSEAALRQAVTAASTIGFSTGPSGVALQDLLQRWRIVDTLRDRLVQAPPGVPVGALVARGEVELGFQQLSELMGLAGIDIVGGMPPGCEIATTFSAARCTASGQAEAVAELLRFMGSDLTAETKRRHGMQPA